MPSSITLTVKHLPTSTSFFLSTLQPLNYVFRGRHEHTIGFGPVSPPNTPADFWITQEIPGVPAGAAHVAFPASSRAQVQDFFFAALKAGGKIHGEPAQRDGTGYYSAAVIDFDGNSIEAVYRPGFGDENKENEDVRSVVSRKSGSLKAPSTIAPPKSVVSQARTKAPSEVRSVTAPSRVSASSLAPQTPEQTQPKPKPQGDVLDTLINEARNAANVARDLVNSVRPHLPGAPSTPPGAAGGSVTGGAGAGEAIVGTLLGVAAGAALHYAFSNRSKESAASNDNEGSKPARPPSATGRSISDPAILRPEYSTIGSGAHYEGGQRNYHAIEPAPSAYTYNCPPGNSSEQRLITMHDNDPPRSEYASTIRPPTARRMSIDSGFGPGPRDLDRDMEKDNVSHASSRTSRQSKKSMKMLEAPPTSYRSPTVLTTAETQVSKARSKSSLRSRAASLSRVISLNIGKADERPSRSRSQSRHSSRRSRRDDFEDEEEEEEEEARTVVHITEKLRSTTSVHTRSEHGQSQAKSYHATSQAGSKAQSQAKSYHATSQAGSKAQSQAKSYHATSQAGSKAQSHAKSYHATSQAGSKAQSHAKSYHATSQAGSKAQSLAKSYHATSQAGSKHSSHRGRERDPEPHEYPLPPSRAATWAGSEAGSFVSAHSELGPSKHVEAPRTIIGKLNPLRSTQQRDFANTTDTVSVVSKQKDLATLDVTDREVRPEDSVSQISVESRRSKARSKASSRR